jgi:hypothetical protein
MQLVACATPQEPLEDAPRSALLADLTEDARWEGFWSSDSYYVRCTRADGAIEWYRLADEVEAAKDVTHGGAKGDAARVLVFPLKARLQTRVVVARSPDGRRMLVGSAGRAGRSMMPRTTE